jgi:two-component system, OmpR family, sensor kinase
VTGRSLRSSAALGAGATLVVEHRLDRALDAALRTRAVAVARLAASAPSLLPAPGALDAPSGGRLLSVEVLDRRRRLVARSASLGGRLLPEGPIVDRALRDGRAGYGQASLSGEPLRLYAAPLAETAQAPGGGVVLVASSLREIDDTISQLRRVIALFALAAAAGGALVASVLTARGLRPLRRLAAGAGAIAAAPDPGRRLPPGTTGDELAELTATLNTMLAALERAQDTERRFLADASHELRNPLTALRGNAAFARRHGADEGLLADIEADAEQLGRIVDDLLVLEREQGTAPPASTVALDALARAVVAREPGAQLGDVAPVSVRGDAAPLERALVNLIDNARVHGPAGATIEVSVRRDGERAVLAVTDEGPGIPPEQVDAAFGRFWRGPAAAGRPGSGLGLAIVAATARRHGGTVEVQGSCVALVLPVVTEPSRSRGTVAAP